MRTASHRSDMKTHIGAQIVRRPQAELDDAPIQVRMAHFHSGQVEPSRHPAGHSRDRTSDRRSVGGAGAARADLSRRQTSPEVNPAAEGGRQPIWDAHAAAFPRDPRNRWE